MRRAIIADEAEAPNEINLTPMLDVVFIMLIFFLVVASFIKEAGLDLNRSETLAPPIPENESILVLIDENSRIHIAERLIDPRAVRANIERLKAEHPTAAVVIRPHKHSTNKALVQVMDASRQAGIYDIAMTSEWE